MAKIIILGGFLGSGKTSVLLQFAHALSEQCCERENSIVIVENEIGEIGIDDKMVSQTGLQVQNLFAGCVCCTLLGALGPTMKEIEEKLSPEYILLETTGVATPQSIIETLAYGGYECSACCVVDASRWRKFVRVMVADLVKSQLGGADIIVINKIDKIDEDELEFVRTSIRENNADAPILETSANTTIDPAMLTKMVDGLSCKTR